MTSAHPAEGARIATALDYVALLKPRVMSLVVFTGLVGYACAPGAFDPILAFASILALAVGAGASGALNMAYDADIDAVMARTRSRPVPAGRIPVAEAHGLGVVLSLLSVTLMALAANPLAAALLAFTIFFYAVVYTRWLKRSTPENIVIGGLAGALPPAIAWAARAGGLSLDPLLLVGIIFLWTPPHFWALALGQAEDYRAAGVPMLPNVKGPAATRRSILGYSLVMAAFALAPLFTGLGGWAYAIASIVGGAGFITLAIALYRSRAGESDASLADRRAASRLFAYSIFYLATLFAALLIERLWTAFA